MKNFFSTVLCLLAFNANAATINYDEATDGDIGPLGLSPYFMLDVGINSISGTVTWASSYSSTHSDWDDVVITIPNGTRLDSITYTINQTPGDTGIFNQTSYRLESGDFLNSNGTILGDDIYRFPLDGFSTFQTTLPLESNDYLLKHIYMAGDLSPGEVVSAAYRWEFNVTAVPVPAAAWLFGTGLLGLIGLARRKGNA